jgi:hypothetical protein
MLWFIFFIHGVLPAQISGSFSEEPFENIIQVLEKDHGYLFSYQPQDVSDIRVTYDANDDSLNVFLENILQATAITFEVIDRQYIILKKDAAERPQVIICGTITDGESGAPVEGANVYLSVARIGTATDDKGQFIFEAPLTTDDTLVLSYVGYEKQLHPIVEQRSSICPDYSLSLLDFGADMIVITEYLTDGIGLREQGLVTQLTPDRIGVLPGQVQSDVLKSAQFLPGISAPDGSASGLNIRGGTADQNLILWEGIPIYHAAHYFDMISAFNPDIIKSVDIYRGGFGAQYGGRVSGVLDLNSWTPTDQSQFRVGTDGLSAFTSGHLSFAQHKGSVTYSLRRSLTDIWQVPVYESITRRNLQGVLVQNFDIDRLPRWINIEEDLQFWDTNLKLAYNISEKDEFSVAVLFAQNDFEDQIRDNMGMQSQQDTLKLNNRGINLSWSHQWNTSWTSRIVAVDSDFDYDYGYSILRDREHQPDIFGEKSSAIRERQVRLINTNQIRDHQLELGYEAVRYDVNFVFTRRAGMGLSVNEQQRLNTPLHVLYGNWTSSNKKSLGYELGLRFTYFGIQNQLYAEPRGRLWYEPSDKLTFSFNAGRYLQWISQLVQIEGDQASIQTPVWTLAGGPEVPVVDAQQYQLGLIYRDKGWLIDLQVYRKRIEGISSLTTGFDEDLSQRFNIGYSDIQGIDILIKKRWGNWQSWWSYTLAKVDYHFSTFFDKEFAAPNDQRHNFNWINRWQKGGWQIALGWKLLSGLPYSPREDFTLRVDPPMNMQPPRTSIRSNNQRFNGDRLPWQHQLDTSVRYQFGKQAKKAFKTTLGMAVSNLYDRENIYRRDLFIRQRPSMMPVLDSVDRQLLGLTFEFLVKFEW